MIEVLATATVMGVLPICNGGHEGFEYGGRDVVMEVLAMM